MVDTEFDDAVDVVRNMPTDSYLPEEIIDELKRKGYRKAEEVKKAILVRVLKCVSTEYDSSRLLYILSKAFPDLIEVQTKETISRRYNQYGGEYDARTNTYEGEYETITYRHPVYRVLGTEKWYG